MLSRPRRRRGCDRGRRPGVGTTARRQNPPNGDGSHAGWPSAPVSNGWRGGLVSYPVVRPVDEDAKVPPVSECGGESPVAEGCPSCDAGHAGEEATWRERRPASGRRRSAPAAGGPLPSGRRRQGLGASRSTSSDRVSKRAGAGSVSLLRGGPGMGQRRLRLQALGGWPGGATASWSRRRSRGAVRMRASAWAAPATSRGGGDVLPPSSPVDAVGPSAGARLHPDRRHTDPGAPGRSPSATARTGS